MKSLKHHHILRHFRDGLAVGMVFGTGAKIPVPCQAPKIASRQLLPLEIIVRGEDRNGMKAKLNHLCQQFDAFEKKAIRWIAVGTSLPGIVVAVIAVMKFLGRV